MRILEEMEQLIHRTTPYGNFEPDRMEHTEPFSMEEMEEALKHSRQKAPDISGITKKHITISPLNLRHTILDIFNVCLNTGYFPDGQNDLFTKTRKAT